MKSEQKSLLLSENTSKGNEPFLILDIDIFEPHCISLFEEMTSFKIKNRTEFCREVVPYAKMFAIEEISKHGEYFPSLIHFENDFASVNAKSTLTPDTITPESVFDFIPVPRIRMEIIHQDVPDLQEKADKIRELLNKEMIPSFFNDRIGYLLAHHIVEPVLKMAA